MLRITLADGEKAIINGAVIRSVGRTQLCIENRVALLRGREVMRPEEATTPARRLYFAAMLAYIDPENREAHHEAVVGLLAAVLETSERPDMQSQCIRFAHEMARGDHYRALTACREVMAMEAEALAAAPASDAA